MRQKEYNKTAVRLLREIYEIANECPTSVAHKIQNRASKTLCYFTHRTDAPTIGEDTTPSLFEEQRRANQRKLIVEELKAGKTLTIYSPEVRERGITRLASRMWEIADDAIRNDRDYRVEKGWQFVGKTRIRTYRFTKNIEA